MAQASPPSTTTQINVELSAELEAVYTNFAIITHSPSEIVIDYARMLPGIPKAKVQARVVMTPLNAKLLLKALQENLEKYEQRYGEVRVPAETGFEG
jgi:hypothetical protein